MASGCISIDFLCLLERYFDGHVLRATNKQVLSFPPNLASQLPAVPFEAVLRYDANYTTPWNRLRQNEELPLEKSAKNAKSTLILKVFDSADPMKFHLGYTERLEYLRQRIRCSKICITVQYIPNLEWIQVIEPIAISSEEQVVSFMDDVMARGSEGLIFRNPSAKYYDAESFLKLVVSSCEWKSSQAIDSSSWCEWMSNR